MEGTKLLFSYNTLSHFIIEMKLIIYGLILFIISQNQWTMKTEFPLYDNKFPDKKFDKTIFRVKLSKCRAL